MEVKYILKISIIFFIFLSIVLLIKHIERTFYEFEYQKNLIKEDFSTQAFCDINKGFELEKACNKLTKENCGLTSCCVYTGDNKCKAGNIKGPTFNSDEKGKTNELSHYYFQNKCYGQGC